MVAGVGVCGSPMGVLGTTVGGCDSVVVTSGAGTEGVGVSAVVGVCGAGCENVKLAEEGELLPADVGLSGGVLVLAEADGVVCWFPCLINPGTKAPANAATTAAPTKRWVKRLSKFILPQ